MKTNNKGYISKENHISIPMTEIKTPKENTSSPNELSLVDLLPPERIKLDVRATSWRDAIRKAGGILLEAGAVTENFIEAMIQIAEELGPYIVIAPGIALPHAEPAAGAKKTALSLIKLRAPIEFGNPANDPVSIVIGLSAIDEKKHVRALQSLARLLLDKEKVRELFNANSTERILKVFRTV